MAPPDDCADMETRVRELEKDYAQTQTLLKTHLRACEEHTDRLEEAVGGLRAEVGKMSDKFDASLSRVHRRIDSIVKPAIFSIAGILVGLIAFFASYGSPWANG